MGYLETNRLPVAIDFSSKEGEGGGVVKPGTAKWNKVRYQVRQALEEHGFFEATNFKNVSSRVRKAMLAATKQAFDLPQQTKQRINVHRDGRPIPDYISGNPLMPLCESMVINDANIYSKLQRFANIYWPQGNPSFCEALQVYSEQALELDQMVRRMILESMGVDKYSEEHLESTYYRFRLMKYNKPQDSKQLGLIPHTDKDIISVLLQNQVDGLQFRTKDGADQWVNVKFSSPDSFIVIAGDCFHAWTNGRVHSPYHRVMMSGNEERYSVGLFSIPKAGYIVRSPQELVDEDHPLLYKPFDHAKFVEFYRTEAGYKAESTLKAYCGL